MSISSNAVPSPPPRAPSQAAWDAMTPEQRRAVVDALPGHIPWWECAAPEGTEHFDAKAEGLDTLRRYFKHQGGRVFLAAELPTYYPDEDRFAPDLLAVRDVDVRAREKWVVSDEGKGLDLIIEVLAKGSRSKDLRTNVVRYAALGVREYFVFDLPKKQVHGWRLPAGLRVYEPLVTAGGALASSVLGLELFVTNGRLRFRNGPAEVFAADDLIERLDELVNERTMALEEAQELVEQANAERDAAVARAEEQARVNQEQARVNEEQARASEEQARRIAELEAELARVKRER